MSLIALKKRFCSSYKYWKNRVIECPICSDKVTLDDYIKTHSISKHGLNEKTHCIFCGKHPFCASLEANNSHIEKCFTVLRKNNRINKTCCLIHSDDTPMGETSAASGIDAPENPEIDAPENPAPRLCHCIPFDTSLLYRRLHHRVVEVESQQAGFYENYPGDFPELTDTGSFAAFDEESNLGREPLALFRMYFSDDWALYHVYIRSYAFSSFKTHMSPLLEAGGLVVSTFWCLCDGCSIDQPQSLASHKLHRHMIVAFRDRAAYFNAWNRVYVKRESERYCKNQKEIMSPMHLANTIHYVSSEKFQKSRKKGGVPKGHFYINRPLHKHAVASMVLLWPTGSMQYIQQMLRNQVVIDWKTETYLSSGERKYRVRVLDVMPELRECPASLRWDYEPHPAGQHTLYWTESDIMRVRPTQASFENRVEAMTHQIELGNSWRQRMKDVYYTLNKQQVFQMHIFERGQQKQAAEMNKLYAINAALERENESLKRKIAELEQKSTTFNNFGDIHAASGSTVVMQSGQERVQSSGSPSQFGGSEN